MLNKCYKKKFQQEKQRRQSGRHASIGAAKETNKSHVYRCVQNALFVDGGLQKYTETVVPFKIKANIEN